MTFNADRIRKITSEILSALDRLEDLRKFPLEEFAANQHLIGSAKYNFIVAIEGIACALALASSRLPGEIDIRQLLTSLEKGGARLC